MIDLPRILIVDDEPAILLGLSHTLVRGGFAVKTTACPLEALDLLQQDPYSLLITDQCMPELSGIELLERARELAPDTVRILLTGVTGNPQAAVDAINRGSVFRYLAKPCKRDELLAVARQATVEHRLRCVENELAASVDDDRSELSEIDLLADALQRIVHPCQLTVNEAVLRARGEAPASSDPLRLVLRVAAFDLHVELEGEPESASALTPDLLRRVSLVLSQLLSLDRQTRRLRRHASRDSLTGVFNRRALDERIWQELGRISRRGQQFSLLLIDMDRFKSVNDTLGHAAGDRLLKDVAGALSSASRVQDSVFRIGGDEFVVLLPDTSLEEARQCAARLQACLSALSTPEMNLPGVGLSIGVSSTQGRPDCEPRELMERADQALYRAKNQGRGMVCVSESA